MHIVAQGFADDKDDAIGDVWREYRLGRISREELVTKQDTILIQRGEVCDQPHCGQAVKAIIAGRKLCAACSRIEMRKSARA